MAINKDCAIPFLGAEMQLEISTIFDLARERKAAKDFATPSIDAVYTEDEAEFVEICIGDVEAGCFG